ncbi:hypothetical protein P700755_003814 [Psychroflexus torquis ATCC 700755]|uniref:Lipid A deacylase LpxR family protein n=1 Tax=Psychroflexus torquis (strain ATCC 700755 / CIP 106069 / ACAM 623) TaxID=313595 RepID=K4IJ57_PSYTT|nr:lipid A deacylase LpxR family protein [Psychroflexus torquis]AFU70389.1 hypothetical protein P700755_003814 [Psychroflexus torquis ATCC 700755]
MKTIIIDTLLILSFITAFAQEKENKHYTYEVELGTDNDFLIAHKSTDKYYTYGINASFRWHPKSANFLNKLLPNKRGYFQSLGINIEGYTPDYKSKNYETDRPYAGWSYVEFQSTYGFEKSFLRLGIDIGILGPDSKAGVVQNWFHEHISRDQVLDGWENQIDNQLGINIRAYYAQILFESKIFDVYASVDAAVGNIYTYVNPGINFRFGVFNPVSKSIAFKNTILANKSNKEVYVDAGVATKISAFNATIQGSKISEINLINSKEINNFFFNSHIGVYYALNRWAVGAKLMYSSGELKDNDSQQYTMISGSYRFN